MTGLRRCLQWACCAAVLACAVPATAQELAISLITRQADGSYAATATVRIPMDSDAAARDAAASLRFWIATRSDIEAAAIIPSGADGAPLAHAATAPSAQGQGH